MRALHTRAAAQVKCAAALEWRYVDMAQRVATLLPDTKTGDARQVPLRTTALAAISALPRHSLA